MEIGFSSPRSAVTTLDMAVRLRKAVDRDNLYIKIPATAEALPAIAQAISEGISVNVTLIFSLARYRQVMDAHVRGLERAVAAGRDLAAIRSVASFFVSRVDSEVDARLDRLPDREAAGLRLIRKGGPARRPPAAAAVGLHRRQEPGLSRHHVRQRAGGSRHRQHDARDHPGRVRRPRPGRGRHDFRDVTEQLEREGLAKFEKSWSELNASVAAELSRA